MRRIDELHLNYPFAGSRMLRDLLGQQGLKAGRRHIATLMKRMCIEAIYDRGASATLDKGISGGSLGRQPKITGIRRAR